MEFYHAHSYGWLENDITLAMTADELDQLRFAASIAIAHGINQHIFEQLLTLTDPD